MPATCGGAARRAPRRRARPPEGERAAVECPCGGSLCRLTCAHPAADRWRRPLRQLAPLRTTGDGGDGPSRRAGRRRPIGVSHDTAGGSTLPIPSPPVMRMEVMKLKSSSGMAKAAGIVLCLAGVLVMALYTGPPFRPLNRHRAFAGKGTEQATAAHAISKGLWIIWTFLLFLGCAAWALWIVFQGLLMKEYPNKLLVTLIQCLFGTIQSCLIAAVAERNHPLRWKLQLDFSLLAVAYSGIVGTGVSLYLQTWCVDMKGPVFLAMWNPLSLLLTVLCSSLLGEITHLGTILGGILLVGGLYSMLWGKAKEEARATTTLEDQEQSREDEQDEGKGGEHMNDVKQLEVPTLFDPQV